MMMGRFGEQDISPVRGTKPEDHLRIEGDRDFHPEYYESFREYPIEPPIRAKRVAESLRIIDSVGDEEMKDVSSASGERSYGPTEATDSYHPVKKPSLFRRPSNLKLEGEFYSTTEQAEKFIEYLLSRRPDLLRKPTTLKLEGDMEIKTENREQFVPLEYQARPPLCKKFTNLHLEGEHYNITENHEKFVPYEYQRRPPITKKETNLHMEGDLDLLPEYRKEFVEYKTERRKPALPVNNLKTDGFYDVTPDSSKPFQQQIHPQIPFLRGVVEGHTDDGFRTRRRNSSLKPQGEMETVTESKTQFVEKPVSRLEKPKVANNLYLEGRIDMNPEYRNAYIDFNRDGVTSPGKVKSRRILQRHNLKSEGKMEISPEYSCSYVNFPRERPQMRRPENSLSSEGEVHHTTESEDKYVPFSNVPRAGSLRREPELKLEGNFECQPEYRKAYIDYLIRERVERKPRPLDNLGTQPRRAFEVEPLEKTSIPSIQPQPTEPARNMPLVPATIVVKPPSSTTSSVASSVKTASTHSTSRLSKSPRNRSLSQIESSVFGPKLTVPNTSRRSSSRSSSPVPPATPTSRRSRTLPRSRNASPRHQTSTESDVSLQRNRKFGNSVRVENLALRSTTPQPPKVDVSARNRWMRDSSQESSSAFVVLDKEINNNYMFKDKPVIYANQPRWTPSWHDSSS